MGMGPFYQYVEDFIEIYRAEFDVIFQTIFENGTYNLLGLTFLILPLVLLSAFYFLWKYPYGNFFHWLIYIALISVIVGIASWQVTYNGIFNSHSPNLNSLLNSNTIPNGTEIGYEDFAYNLLPKYSIINGVMAAIVSFIYSLILKQFSKIQIHLPF